MSVFSVLSGQKTYTVTFRKGESLLAVLQREGFSVSAPCGGNGKCGNCTVILQTGSSMQSVLACRTPAQEGCTVVLEESNDDLSWNFTKNRFAGSTGNEQGLGAAVDLGTTSIAVSVFDLFTGEKLGTRGEWNEQRTYGADVITRISYTMAQKDGLERLSRIVRQQIRRMAESICREHNRSWAEIRRIFLAGNTTMQHLFAGLPPASIAAAPFTPVSYFTESGTNELDGKQVVLSPCVSGYLGGDITAGLAATGLDFADGNHLFLDVGTNGEMALGGKNGFVTCAVACGPAFEGAGISCGMPAAPGAINRFSLSGEELSYEIIGGGEAKGICGSGLLDLAACLISLGYITEYGQLLADAEEWDEESVFPITDTVALTGRDVRQLQLAKAAVAAGIRVLLKESGLTCEEIEAVHLSGGFGSRLDPKSAVAIGMLPKELLGKIRPSGNTSLAGAETALLTGEEKRLLKIQGMCRYLELSSSEAFRNAFVEEMLFPGE
ncbi:MAG: DUF4445 domain-containing protein [Oscillospiraceae bacterium]|nr:DUF4445 domain-containing protein [Oscillospiraceae bacterium]